MQHCSGAKCIPEGGPPMLQACAELQLQSAARPLRMRDITATCSAAVRSCRCVRRPASSPARLVSLQVGSAGYSRARRRCKPQLGSLAHHLGPQLGSLGPGESVGGASLGHGLSEGGASLGHRTFQVTVSRLSWTGRRRLCSQESKAIQSNQVINRPGVAGAVLHTASLLIN